MLFYGYFSLLALLAGPAAAATAADVPGGPGTAATLSVGASASSDLGTAADADWFRTSLQANKLYAFTVTTLVAEGADFRLSVKDAGGRTLAAANLGVSTAYAEVNQLNFRPTAAGRYFLAVEAGAPRVPTTYTVGLARDVSAGFADAVRVQVGADVSGTLQSEFDVDYFVVRLEKGRAVDLVADVDDRDAVILYDRNRGQLGFVDVDLGKLAYFVPPYTGDYYVSARGCCSGLYSFRVVSPADRGTATPFSDVLIGTNGPDLIDALAGDDTVRGLAGNDILRGGPGSDDLLGGPGNDRLNGGQGSDGLLGDGGDDVLIGGLGTDFLTGGPGVDRFLFFGNAETGYDAGVPEFDGRDYISDFARGDRIDLRGVDANATRPGRQSFRFVGTTPFTGPAQVRYRIVDTFSLGRQILIEMNTDGDPQPESIVQLTNRFIPRAGDFIFRDPAQGQ